MLNEWIADYVPKYVAPQIFYTFHLQLFVLSLKIWSLSYQAKTLIVTKFE